MIELAVGTSILLIALGAVLAWVVSGSVIGISLTTLGVIALVAGAAGIVYSLIVSRDTRHGTAA